MTKSLPILACLTIAVCAAVAGGQSPPPGGNPPAAQAAGAAASGPQGDALMEQVVVNLDAVPTVSAKIRHRIDLMGRSLKGTGDYVQQGRGEGRAFRLNLHLRTTLSATSIDQVCDGQQLWIFEQIDGNDSLSLVNLARLHRARPKSQEAAPPSALTWLSLGGLPKLALNMKESFHFGDIVQSRLDEFPVWTIEGHWNTARLAQLLPDQAEAINAGRGADLNQLTPNVPHRVVLHLGADDLFPYRIEYWRTDTGPEGENLAPVQKLLAVMEWYEVQLGGPVDPTRFVYRPPEKLIPVDRTKEWLDRLGLEDPPPAEATRRFRSRR